MKSLVIILASFLVFLSLSCSPALDNSITISSIATQPVYVNVLGKLISLKTNETKTIKQISKGEYEYAITFEIPAGVQSATSEGGTTGSFLIKEGTQVRMFFASRIQQTTGGGSGTQSTYVLLSSVSSSDKVTTSTTTGP